jgi:hypothetical protein
MANALDTILKHIQKDPTAMYLFQDDESETSSMVIEPNFQTQNSKIDNTKKETTHDGDAQIHMREHSGSKRQLSDISSQKIRHGPDPQQSSPQQSPPPKKERLHSSQQPSAIPVRHDRKRGQT